MVTVVSQLQSDLAAAKSRLDVVESTTRTITNDLNELTGSVETKAEQAATDSLLELQQSALDELAATAVSQTSKFASVGDQLATLNTSIQDLNEAAEQTSAEQPAGINLVRNSDFTLGASGWEQPPGKLETVVWTDGLDVIVHRADETKHDAAASVVYKEDWGKSNLFPVDPKRNYEFSVWQVFVLLHHNYMYAPESLHKPACACP